MRKQGKIKFQSYETNKDIMSSFIYHELDDETKEFISWKITSVIEPDEDHEKSKLLGPRVIITNLKNPNLSKSLFRSQLKTLVVIDLETSKSYPLKVSQWVNSISNGEVESDKTVNYVLNVYEEFEIARVIKTRKVDEFITVVDLTNK